VLVVDDDPQIRRLVAGYLGRYGYEVALAEDGREGWRMFQQRPYALVITDLKMPALDGAALLARIKAVDGDTPVVIITGQGREAVRHMVGSDGGAQAVLHKPFNLDTLLKIVAPLAATEAAAAAVGTLDRIRSADRKKAPRQGLAK
jgi:DNA-binding response OmpR family regulator